MDELPHEARSVLVLLVLAYTWPTDGECRSSSRLARDRAGLHGSEPAMPSACFMLSWAFAIGEHLTVLYRTVQLEGMGLHLYAVCATRL